MDDDLAPQIGANDSLEAARCCSRSALLRGSAGDKNLHANSYAGRKARRRSGEFTSPWRRKAAGKECRPQGRRFDSRRSPIDVPGRSGGQ